MKLPSFVLSYTVTISPQIKLRVIYLEMGNFYTFHEESRLLRTKAGSTGEVPEGNHEECEYKGSLAFSG